MRRLLAQTSRQRHRFWPIFRQSLSFLATQSPWYVAWVPVTPFRAVRALGPSSWAKSKVSLGASGSRGQASCELRTTQTKGERRKLKLLKPGTFLGIYFFIYSRVIIYGQGHLSRLFNVSLALHLFLLRLPPRFSEPFRSTTFPSSR